MSSEDDCRKQADALLRLAAVADNMRDRSRLIDEAMTWHNRALAAHDERRGADARDRRDDGGERRASARI